MLFRNIVVCLSMIAFAMASTFDDTHDFNIESMYDPRTGELVVPTHNRLPNPRAPSNRRQRSRRQNQYQDDDYPTEVIYASDYRRRRSTWCNVI